MQYWLLSLGAIIIGMICGFFLCAVLTAGKEADAWLAGYEAGMKVEMERVSMDDRIEDAMVGIARRAEAMRRQNETLT